MKQATVLLVLGCYLPHGPFLWANECKTAQQRAVAEIHNLGGTWEVDQKTPDNGVIAVNLADLIIENRNLAALKDFPNLQVLSLAGSKIITNDGLRFLPALPQLRSLDLKDLCIGDDGLKYLEGLSGLRILDLNTNHIGD